jgi:pimeloyl-ACP methyl ester carboxylesterase
LVDSLTRPGRWSAFRATVAGANHDQAVGPFLGSTKAPALVVVGDADPDWADPVAEATWVVSNFSDSELITVPGAGHAPMFEKPELVTPGVLSFLEKINFNATGASTKVAA